MPPVRVRASVPSKRGRSPATASATAPHQPPLPSLAFPTGALDAREEYKEQEQEHKQEEEEEDEEEEKSDDVVKGVHARKLERLHADERKEGGATEASSPSARHGQSAAGVHDDASLSRVAGASGTASAAQAQPQCGV